MDRSSTCAAIVSQVAGQRTALPEHLFRASLEAMQSQRYDMIITDCMMSGMDVYALAREIRRREQGSADRMPVKALTASAMQADIDRCLAAGMDDVLTKPIVLETLRAMLSHRLPRTSDVVTTCLVSVDANAAGRNPLVERFGSEEAAKQLVGSMRKSMGQDLGELMALISEGDATQVKSMFHRMISAIAMFGDRELIGDMKEMMADVERDGVAANRERLISVRVRIGLFLSRYAGIQLELPEQRARLVAYSWPDVRAAESVHPHAAY